MATIATKERVGLIMKNGKISMEEAEERAWEGADEIEALLARRNGESDEDGNDSRKYFATQFMSLLIETYDIDDPVLTTNGTDSE